MANETKDIIFKRSALESSLIASLGSQRFGMAQDTRRLVYADGVTMRYYWDSTRLADQTTSYGTALIGTPGITGITPSGGSSGAAATLQAMLTGLAGTGNANFIQNGTVQQASSNFNISGAGVIGTTLDVTGTSRFRSYSSVGDAPASNNAFIIYGSPTGLAGSSQYSLNSQATLTSATTVVGAAIYSKLTTAAAAFTMADGSGVLIETPSIGAGSAVTNLYGLKINDQTGGGTNYALYTGAGLVRFGGAATTVGVHTFTAAPILSALTASLPVFTNGSKALVSNAMTGTGSVMMSASPTTTGTLTAAAANFSGAVSTGALSATTGDFTGNVSVTSTTFTLGASTAADRNLIINANAGQARDIRFMSAGSSRWALLTSNDAEVGSSAGSNFQIRAHTDAGSVIDSPIYIYRAAGGNVEISRPVTASSTLALTGNFTNTVLAGTGTRLVTSTSTGLLGNATTIAGNYVFSGNMEVTLALTVTDSSHFLGYVSMTRDIGALADGSFMASVEGTVIKNDSNTRTHYGLQILPILNAGASNANTTFIALDVDTDNTATTGITTTLMKLSYGGAERLRVDSAGGIWTGLSADQVVYAGSGGDAGKLKSAPMYIASGAVGFGATPGVNDAIKVAPNSGIATISIDPTTGSPAAPSASYSRLYLKGGWLVVQYNDAGTTRYKYLDLAGTGVTWVHTTSAP